MKEIPKELNIVLTKDKFEVNKEITLTRKSYIHQGQGELKHIKWCEYQLPSDIGEYIEELRSYDTIALSFFALHRNVKRARKQIS